MRLFCANPPPSHHQWVDDPRKNLADNRKLTRISAKSLEIAVLQVALQSLRFEKYHYGLGSKRDKLYIPWILVSYIRSCMLVFPFLLQFIGYRKSNVLSIVSCHLGSCWFSRYYPRSDWFLVISFHLINLYPDGCWLQPNLSFCWLCPCAVGYPPSLIPRQHYMPHPNNKHGDRVVLLGDALRCHSDRNIKPKHFFRKYYNRWMRKTNWNEI